MKAIPFATCMIAALVISSGTHAKAQSKSWQVPSDAMASKNPVASNPASLKEGKTLYTAYCTPCHGDKGKGDGPAAAALNPKPADHTSPALLNETDGALFYKITQGRGSMPQYKAALTDNQRWELVAYIRTLRKASKK